MKISLFAIFYVTTILTFTSCMEVIEVCRRQDGARAVGGKKKEVEAKKDETKSDEVVSKQAEKNTDSPNTNSNAPLKQKDSQNTDEGLIAPAENLVPHLLSRLEQGIARKSVEKSAANSQTPTVDKQVVTKTDLAKSLELLLNLVKDVKPDKISDLKTEIDNIKDKVIKDSNKKTRKATKSGKKQKRTTTKRTTTQGTTTAPAIKLRAHEPNTVDLMDRIMEEFEKEHKVVSNENSEEDVSHSMRTNDDLYYDLTQENGGVLKYKLVHDYQ